MGQKKHDTDMREATAGSHTLLRADQRLWTQAEAAHFLGLSTRWIRDSNVPKVLIPGTGPKGKLIVRYDPADLVAWVAAHKTSRRIA